MNDWLKRLLQNSMIFRVVLALLALGLLAFWLQDEFRMAVTAMLLALMMGGYMLYIAFSPGGRYTIPRTQLFPDLTRWQVIIFGLAAVAFGLFILTRTIQGDLPTRRQVQQRALQQRLAGVEHSTWLDLSGLNLREVPPVVWQMTHLTDLNLNRNRLSSLSADIQNLTHLEHLDLWNNRLTTLPPEIGALSHLEWLDVGDNRLETLPPEIAHLQQLIHLELQYNHLTEFSDVILELPNLDALNLSGNRMGELPASFVQRAEASGLDITYSPYASRINLLSAFVIGLTFVLPVVLSIGIEHRWRMREHVQRQAAQQQGIVFPIPPQLRLPTLFAMLGIGAVYLVFFVASLHEETTGIAFEGSVMMFLIFCPLIIVGILFLRHHTGLVILTNRGIHSRRPGHDVFLAYDAITALESRTNPFTAGLFIHGAGFTLPIPRTLENFPHFYELVLNRVAPAVREAALEGSASTSSPSAAEDAGITLSITPRMRALYIVATVLFIGLYLGFSLLGLWMSLAQMPLRDFTPDHWRSILFFFLMISVIFVPVLIFVIRSFFTRYGPRNIEQPVAWEFYPDRLRYRFPRSEWYKRPARDLQRITLEPIRVTVRGSASVKQQVTIYMIVLEFSDSHRLAISQGQAVAFGSSTEKLYSLISRYYGQNMP
ncbi:MAG: leucine-rich repeat domain-containing protein [Anaerolineae bacterium]|nr:leucine-rich repeat domain-containing protein [Anaerolineae bacterium]